MSGKKRFCCTVILAFFAVLMISGIEHKFSDTPEHIPNDVTIEEHADIEDETTATFYIGEEQMLTLVQEAFEKTLELSELSVDVQEDTISLSGSVNTSAVCSWLSKQDSSIAQAYSILLLQLNEETIPFNSVLYLQTEENSLSLSVKSASIQNLQLPDEIADQIFISALQQDMNREFHKAQSA